MRNKLFLLVMILAGLQTLAAAQELQARVTINARGISSETNRRIFQTLQNSLTTMLNNRKWTTETFATNEKIVCQFLINVTEALPGDVYKGSITVQAVRPIFNTNYESPLVNFNDESFTFKYVEFQPVEFNENRVSGSDPLASNLTATVAYYVYLILGLDFDSFSLRGGDPYFQKLQQIVNNAPENRDISGWKAFDGLRNRYWLSENLTNNRYTLIHDAIYSYYRLGMDVMYENETDGRNAVLNTINILNTLNSDIPNTMIMQFFFQGRSNELIKLFKKASPDDKQRAREILSKVDISNANNYKQELK